MKKFNRRHFLQNSSLLMGGTALTNALTSCANIDQYFTPDSSLMLDRVMIVGAGLAGLHAAYQLKKKNIPFCVFEAGGSYGGRVRTLLHYNSEDQYVDIGARAIESTHQDVFSLCKELGLRVHELGDVGQKADQLVMVKGTPVPLKKFLQDLVPLFRKVSQLRNQFFEWDDQAPNIFKNAEGIQNYDRLSLDELLTELQRQMSPEVRQTVLQAMTSAFGVDPQNLSALQFLYQFNEHSSLMPFQRGQVYGVEGGTSQLTQRLFDRSEAIVKDYAFKFLHKCTSINRKGSAFQLSFDTEEGSRNFVSRHVIFAMPSAQLKTVYGWHELGMDPDLHKAIQEAALSSAHQFLYKTSSRFWEKKFPQLDEGKVFGDAMAQNGQSRTSSQSGSMGIYGFQVGGQKSPEQLASLTSATEGFLRQTFQPSVKEKIEFADMIAWDQIPFVRGYRAVHAPGNFLSHADTWRNSRVKGLYFVGEHVDPRWLGTMQGALASSAQAVQKINLSDFKT